jgi:SAM-dependent methyltransferase/glycosyltransferase involved in cell wall biosynthesis
MGKNTLITKTRINRVRTKKEKQDNACCIFLNTYYDKFINSHYSQNPHLASVPYQDQLDSLQSTCFGDSDFYSDGFIQAGWDAENLVINCAPLQQTWAKENNFTGDGLAIAVEQVRRKRPQVIYLQDLNLATKDFLNALRPFTELIVGQIASPVPPRADITSFDIIFSSFPHFVERFRRLGITSYYQPLAFDPRVLDMTGNVSKQYDITFVGGMSPAHGKGQQFLDKLSHLVPLDCWGYGAESLPANSPLRLRHHGEVWGLDMFTTLAHSRITVNRHLDVAENYANNMRLFEATGCGAMLVTDYKDNLNELFEIGSEVVAYRNPEEAAALITYYLQHPEESREIARKGQQRTLRDHTYSQRMKQTAKILSRHLRYKREISRFPHPDLSKISYGFTEIQQSEVSGNLTSGWQNGDIPSKQRALVQKELNEMYKGKPPVVYSVLADILTPYIRQGSSLLEIGCASGYYFEILEYLLGKQIAYTGADYSLPLINMAKDYYPSGNFVVADGANLPFGDNKFPIAISSGILLHVPNYMQHLAETVRVASEFVVLHRTPVCRQGQTRYYKKLAYGIETVELCFNEKPFISQCEKAGLKLIKALEYYSNPEKDCFEVTYLFRKCTPRNNCEN